jgi:triacylglycerol lipase
LNSKLHHIDVGSGDPVVLIHGLSATHRYWSQNIRHLSHKRRVLAIDLPGFGRSEKPDLSYSTEFFVDTLARFLDEKSLSRASLVGNSMGGHIAMAFALAHPGRVDKLVLVDPVGVTALPLWAIRSSVWLMANGPLRKVAPRALPPLRDFLLKTVFPTRPDLVARYVRSHNHAIASDEYPLHLRAVFRSMLGALRRPMRRRAREIGAPTLICWGERDYMVPVTAAHGLRKTIPHSRLLIYGESGHCPMVDQPDRWNRDVERFLDGHPVGR